MTYGDDFHPIVSFAYCVSLVFLSMVYFNPVFILTGICFAVLQNIIMYKPARFLRMFAWSAVFSLAVVIFNPIVSHSGKTLLFYLFGNPVTFEALFFGICSGGMLMLVFLWFGVYNKLVTPDRFMYIFSRLPATSMLVTMTQRMIPLFTRRTNLIKTAQKTLPPALAEGETAGFFGRIRRHLSPGLSQISILLSWSMEDGLDTADSMKARGYGVARRSSFSVYRFTKRDAAALFFIVACAVCSASAFYACVDFEFYPRVHAPALNSGFWVSIVLYAVLAAALPAAVALRFAVSKVRGRGSAGSKCGLKWSDIWQS